MAGNPDIGMPAAAASGGVRRLAPPPRSLPVSAIAVAVVAAVSLGFWVRGLNAVDNLDTTDGYRLAATIVVCVFATATTLVLIPGIHSVVLSSRARALAARGDIVGARRMAARAREKAHRTLGYALASLIVLALALFLLTNDAAIIETFFSWDQIRRSAKDVLKAFWLNL